MFSLSRYYQFSKVVLVILLNRYSLNTSYVPSIIPSAEEYTSEQNSPCPCEVYLLLEGRWMHKYESVLLLGIFKIKLKLLYLIKRKPRILLCVLIIVF